ncbi:MAG: Cytochrome oxidase Cu insertion factor, SCO1/SenC/PrrC family [Candidatus Kapaibacterium sp.]|nr:MAG: Cytochrome oxidase Cu insertion factor, SCO1/SenC/PrrC family [Candidatus Kapabacteria bacterium]
MRKIIVFLILLFLSIPIFGNENDVEVGIVEKLGNKIPLDLVFTNDKGKKVQLKEIIDKPTILMFVYYHCPGICSPLLTGVSEVVDKADIIPGKDYRLLTVSFDHTETWDKAKKWKENHLKGLERQVPSDGWYFLVGDSISVRKLTNAVGFYFKPDGKGDFIHGAALYSIAPDGKIIRYLFGTEFNPFDFKMAVLEAEKGIPLPTVNRLLKFCYSYDPQGRRYMFNFTRVFGAIMLLGLSIYFIILVSKPRKKEVKNG